MVTVLNGYMRKISNSSVFGTSVENAKKIVNFHIQTR
jgi:hypothetical protein